MSKATVKVERDQYKVDGEFSAIIPGTPIRDEEGRLCGVTKPRQIVHMHSYGGEALFFDALSKGRLLATRCANPACTAKGTVYLPFRTCCPDCLANMEPIDYTEVAKAGAKVYTFIVTERSGAFNTLVKPIRFIDIEFPGAATLLKGYMVAGEPRIGLRVVPVFRREHPTFTITDLAWAAEGTKPQDLPPGFSFASNERIPGAAVVQP